MNNSNSSLHSVLSPKSTKSNQNQQDFWNGTLVENYNFLMSEELIYQCKRSLGEPFSSWNDLAVHHVSYNEFEKQYIELSEWCEKSSEIMKEISSNTLTCYLRQKYYEDLYEQGLMRLRMFNQYSNKLIARFPDLKIVINEKKESIYRIWNELERGFIGYLDEDFDRIIHDLGNELFLFEEWMIEIEEQLEKFSFHRNEKILFEDFEELLKLQNEIKSKNSCVSSLIEICERLKNDYQQQSEQIPLDYATDLENQWHQIWIYSVEIQCKLEERLKTVKHSTSFSSIDDEDDIIPFNSSEYEKLSLTSSLSNSSGINRKRPRSPDIPANIDSQSSPYNRKMAKPKRRMSLNVLPHLSPSIFYYSLTNINDDDDHMLTKKQKKTSSKLDIGYASEDDFDKKPIYILQKSKSDSTINSQPTFTIFSSLTHSLPIFEHHEWWRHSITSAYDTCSNPDIDLSMEETKKTAIKPSLLMYSKKYLKMKAKKSSLISNSYDASAEYTDPEQSENDMEDISSSYPYPKSDSLFYNRYTTTTTGYSSDIELEPITTTISPEMTEQKLGEMSPMNNDRLILPSVITIESSEPCWDGYQNPLFYPLNSQDIDSIETTLKWDDQFFEMDQLCHSTSDEELYIQENFNRFLRKNNGGCSSSSLITSITNAQQFDSDSDLDDFNYVINETKRQLLKTRQSIEKRKRQEHLSSIFNDNNQRKYDEILRTCQTNIQCLQQILKNLHRSNNLRLNNTRAIELLQTYLSYWHDMQEQVNNDRIRARHFLHLSQEIIKLKVRLEEEISHLNNTLHSSCFEKKSLNELKQRIAYEFEYEKSHRQQINSFYSDLHLAEEHFKDYQMTYPDGPLSFNLDEHLHTTRLTLDQLTNKMNSYQIQLRTLLKMIDNLSPIENHIEQKLTSLDYPIDLQELQTLIDNYEGMIPMNTSYEMIQNHGEYKLEIYRKMFNDILRKQEKHVSFNGSNNLNNNNSTTINSSTSSNSSTPQQQQQYSTEHFRHQRNLFNKFRQTEIGDIQQNFTASESSNKQSTTSSYISDDCKVLYIETVIEVDKPVFYERTTDTSSTINTEYHHIPQSSIDPLRSTTLNTNKYYMDNTSNNHAGDSSDDDDDHTPNGGNTSSRRSNTNHSRQHGDSGIELDQTSSSSTIYNQQTDKNRLLLFPPTSQELTEPSEPTLLRRVQKQKVLDNDNFLRNRDQLSSNVLHLNSSNTHWDRLKRNWFRSLLTGLLILLLLFFIYFCALDRCSRSTIIQTVCRKIISIENEGPPTI